MNNLEMILEYSSFIREKKSNGKKTVAYICHDNVPEEIFDAAGFIPIRLMFAGNDELMNMSHDYLPPSTCAFAQSCIGLFAVKPAAFRFLDMIDYVLISNHCVSDICASEIISKYFNIPNLTFYMPYISSKPSLQYYKLELQYLIEQLEEITNTKITPDKILSSIKKYNNFKKFLQKINDTINDGLEKLKIIQKAMLFGPDILPELESYINNHENEEKVKDNNAKQILLTGCSLFINDFVIDVIQETGANIVFFDTWIGSNYFSQTFEDERLSEIEDPLELLTVRFKNNLISDHNVSNFFKLKVSQIKKIIKEYEAKTGKKLGIINNIIKFCDHFSIMSAHFKTMLQKDGIRVLNLERDYSLSARGQISTRIEAFLEMI